MTETVPLDLMIKLEENLTKNSLWIYILKLLDEKPMHAYAIDEAIRKKFGFSVAKITPYVHLYKLERCGLVKSKERRIHNRPVKVYELTKEGEKILQESLKVFKKVADMLAK